MLTVPIFALSGQLAGASDPKSAWASLQALCPSAASGLIVNPSGSSTSTVLTCDAAGVVASVCSALNVRSSPDGASVSLVVSLLKKTGLNVSLSQPVTAG